MASVKYCVGSIIVTSLYYLFRVFPVKENKIFVDNFYGRGYGDSPKYIVEYLLANYPGFDIVWIVKDKYVFPKGIRTVNNSGYLGMIRAIYEQTTSKVWIDNCRKYAFERKRKSQFYIQTWHGDMCVKKIEGDVIGKLPKREVECSKNDSRMANLFICGNKWMYNRYREAFWYKGDIAICGLPRRDILYQYDISLVKKIKKSLCIESNYKVLLYVPTFRREDLFNHHLGEYASLFDWNMSLEALENKFKGKWIGLMRLHPNAARYKKELLLPDNVIDVTDYPDINELLLISDCCISDYSSSILEFAITKKPSFVFAPDKNEYNGERGYYFSEEELPFSVASTMQELISNIEMFDEEDYLRKHHIFYKEILQIIPEGRASEFLAKRILEVCKS